jgi:DNA polymerase elongation subunit (family B)
MMKTIHFKKKHYVYFEYDKKGKIICIDGTTEPKLECKGILLARRDNCKWSRFIYKDIVLSVFDEAAPIDIFKKIVDVILEVVDAKYETIVEKFSVVKGMGSNYKSKTAAMFVFGEQMKALKRPIQPGERVKYVVVKDHKDRKRVSEKMRTVDLFHECWDASGLDYGDVVPEDFEPEEGMYPPEELDSVYYVEKVLMNPIDRLFGCVFNRVIEPFTKVGYKPHKNKRLGKAYASTPVKMIVQAIKDHKKVIEKKGFRCMAKPIKSFVGWYEKIKPLESYEMLGDITDENEE